jgi:hypothetical protein
MPEIEKRAKRKFNLVIPVFFTCLILGFFIFRGSVKVAEGLGDSASANVAGYAWSSNFQWISFSCINTGTCASSNYGVNINTASDGNQYNLGGHAWSSSAGWISFTYDGASYPPPDNWKFKTSCKSGYTCDNTTNCTACYNPDDRNIYGWARVVGLGNDGWISLGTSTAAVPYRVSIDQNSASGSFVGFGWNAASDPYKGLGWISFNCNNPGYFNTCGTANYFVYLKEHPPAATILKAPNYTINQACAASSSASGVALDSYLRWTFSDIDSGSIQSAYQVIVNTSNSTSSWVFNTGVRMSSTNQYHASNTSLKLNYNTKYYWWVKVWDDFGMGSLWHQFNTSTGDIITDNKLGNYAAGGSNLTFTTYRHEMPNPYFHFIPAQPLAYDSVTTTDALSSIPSRYYTTGAPASSTSCFKSKNACSWYWFGIYNLTNSAQTSSSTVMTFQYGSGARIETHLTDSDGYGCTTSSNPFFIDLLPSWKEKKAP